ncbi:Acyl-CoA synthetase (AMP-forming)/AMP-acid ligase II [Desulfatibacillum alkenivorans DSM 16219]|jgi:acyl-CoA synthetase (AMP-forming)/AMP-acid ligase II|uniref:Acyl-CoA synthetase (AMP-forming)/AMP-acid ligase II n=1 Tax=Desulfatibacillum alkenivorans DSM 16219 TaxID=1121393 RepID=A0A1M6MM48_9BACT|nr:AMP-binding protein [Desulfatibacillum alkenivorans]SHJ84551.1 Acyl-CoA synthetase (AMP-forming)/AMP-acid ligase II [Desulfatibacillum alkenivorans DSM 16219]
MHYSDKPWLKHYDPGIEAEIEIPSLSYRDILEQGLTRFPDKPALFFMGKTITFKDLDRMSARFAAHLAKCGYGVGDVAGIHMPNIPQYLIALAGVQRAGMAATGISMLLKPRELAHQLNDSGAKVLVTLDVFFEQALWEIRDQVPALEKVYYANVGDFMPFVKKSLGAALKKIPTGLIQPISGKTVEPILTILKEGDPTPPEVSVKPEDTCLIQYTGGTTGLPKGVVLTHRNIVANVEQQVRWSKFEPGKDVFCSGFPFFHMAGKMMGMAAMSTSSAQCLIPDPRNTKHIAGEIKAHKATVLVNVPTLYQMLLDEPAFKSLDFSNVRMCVSGAAPFSVDAIKRFEALVGKGKVIEVYGMTETSPLSTSNPHVSPKKIGSVGIPLSNTDIKIMDVETGTREMPFGEEGEICVSGPQVMAGYHNKPHETSHALREHDGKLWMHTGDVGRMDEDGYIYLVDRAKDMLIVGGYKVFSREVEEVLSNIPSVELCAIIGIPNPERPGSETVKAVVQLAVEYLERDKGQLKEEILAYCRENMSPYKVPKIVEFVDAIPLTAVGKVDKKALRPPKQ